MTREEAIKELQGHKGIIIYPSERMDKTLDMAISALEQQPCDEKRDCSTCKYEEYSSNYQPCRDCGTLLERYTNWEQKERELPCEDIAQERYKDLCEYFGDAKDILKSREDFKAWLERVKWHIRKAEELYEKYEYKKESCEDAVSREKVLMIASSSTLSVDESVAMIKRLPSVTVRQIDNHLLDGIHAMGYREEHKDAKAEYERQTGEWITTRTFMHDGEFYCSKCKCDAPQNERWNFCPNCGAKMRGVE